MVMTAKAEQCSMAVKRLKSIVNKLYKPEVCKVKREQ